MSVRPTGPQSRWKPLLSGNGYMGISLNSRNHTGPALAAIVGWINANTNFDRFRIGLSDTLNRHNYMMEGLSYAEATSKAQAAGDQWLNDNADTLATPPAEIIRWENWYQKPGAIEENKRKYLDAYNSNPAFRDAVNADIGTFFARRGQSLAGVDFSRAQHSLDYLIEELAVYEEIFRDYPCTTIYPGKQLKCFEVIRSGAVTGLSETIPGTEFLRLNLHVAAERSPEMAA